MASSSSSSPPTAGAPPAMPPASSFPPGYLQQSRGGEIIGVTTAFLVMEVIATLLRMYSRKIQKAGFMWSDAMMPISLLFNVGLCVCAYLAVRWGAGKHTAAVSIGDMKNILILGYYGVAAIYPWAVTFSKLSILDLYLHVFVDRFSRWTCYLVGMVLILSAIVNFSVSMAQCTPVHQMWDPVPGGHCNNTRIHYAWASFPNIVTDLVMLVLPIPVIRRLHTTWQVKLGLYITFFVGSVGLATGVVRFAQFLDYGWSTNHNDLMWTAGVPIIWSVIESGVYHLAACFLTFRPLILWVFCESRLSPVLSKFRTSSTRTTAATASSSYEPKRIFSNGTEDSLDVKSTGDLSMHGKGAKDMSGTDSADETPIGEYEIRVSRAVTISRTLS